MQILGRVLQIFGLCVVPLALIYYFSLLGQRDERELMTGELLILVVGAVSFWLGHLLSRGRGERSS